MRAISVLFSSWLLINEAWVWFIRINLGSMEINISISCLLLNLNICASIDWYSYLSFSFSVRIVVLAMLNTGYSSAFPNLPAHSPSSPAGWSVISSAAYSFRDICKKSDLNSISYEMIPVFHPICLVSSHSISSPLQNGALPFGDGPGKGLRPIRFFRYAQRISSCPGILRTLKTEYSSSLSPRASSVVSIVWVRVPA